MFLVASIRWTYRQNQCWAMLGACPDADSLSNDFYESISGDRFKKLIATARSSASVEALQQRVSQVVALFENTSNCVGDVAHDAVF